jgi:hypothetical protein
MIDPKLHEVLRNFPGWRLDPAYKDSCWMIVFIDGEGRGLHFNTTHAKGRYVITGCWPKNANYTSPAHHSITVSKDRPAEKIAEDIKRRFLPGYLDEFARLKDLADARDKYQAKIEGIRLELAQLIGGKQGSKALYGPCSMRVDVHDPDCIQVECRCTLATAKKLLTILTG